MENSKEQKVILIITDISGYTRFMLSNRQSLRHGQIIITELTKEIIPQVDIPLEISKLEGDAVFLPTDTKRYASNFHRFKNLALNELRSMLINLGWARLPKFNHLTNEVGKS